MSRPAGSPVARFWSKVDRRGPDECWLWTAATKAGYGEFMLVKGTTVHAHRYALGLALGRALTGGVVMHTCDNPPCVNPAHLRVGTQADNIADMDRKGRRRGVRPAACRRGHAFDEANTRYRPTGGRACRTCERVRCLARYHAVRQGLAR